MSDPKSAWHHAVKAQRDYITPEDITAAMDAGAAQIEIQQEVLEALSRRVCEDWSCCAFVASKRWRADEATEDI